MRRRDFIALFGSVVVFERCRRSNDNEVLSPRRRVSGRSDGFLHLAHSCRSRTKPFADGAERRNGSVPPHVQRLTFLKSPLRPRCLRR